MRVTSQGSSSPGPGEGGRRDSHISGRRGGSRRIGFWLAIAALLHAELVLLIGIGLYFYAPRSADLARGLSGGEQGPSIDVGMVDDDAAREIVAELEKQEEARKAEEARKEEESVHAPGQVVDLPAPREEKRPDSAKFVSEHDSSVERETKKLGHFEDNARQGDTSGTAATSQPAMPKGDGRLAMRTPDLGRFLRGATGATGEPSRAGRPGSSYGALGSGEPRSARRLLGLGGRGPATARGAARAAARGWRCVPTEQQLARAIGSGTQDALANVEDGEETALNSKKWRFASFFNRVKRQVAEHWHPRGVVSPARSDRDDLRQAEPLHRAAHPAQARRAPRQRRRSSSRADSIFSTTRRSRRSSRRRRFPTHRASWSRPTGSSTSGSGSSSTSTVRPKCAGSSIDRCRCPCSHPRRWTACR